MNRVVFAGDEAVLALAAPTEFERFQFAAASYSTAIGEDGLRLRFSASRLDTRPSDIDLKGRAETFGAALTYPAIAANDRALTLSAAFDALNSENAAFGQIIDTSRTRVRHARRASQSVPGADRFRQADSLCEP